MAPAWWPLDRRRAQWCLITLFIFACASMGTSATAATIQTNDDDTVVLAHAVANHKKHHLNATAVSIDRNHLHAARVETYRNGYGTQFQCNATCYFMTVAYLVCIAALLGLLAVIPVQRSLKPEQAPFLLWFGNHHDHQDPFATVSQHKPKGCLSTWLYGKTPEDEEQLEEVAPPPEMEPSTVEQQQPAKTYESIAVETDDVYFPRSPPPPPVEQKPIVVTSSDYMVIDDVDKLFDALPPPSPSKKPGIFSSAAPRAVPTPLARETSDIFGSSLHLTASADPSSPSTRMSGSRRGSSSPRKSVPGGATGGGRRSTVIGGGGATGTAAGTPASEVMSRESMLDAVERRTSMQKRAEKRKEYAKSDISHDNLRDHELHMYEYLEFVRELLDGTSIKKVCQKSAKVVKRTFFITPDLAVVYWNSVGTKAWIVKKSSLETSDIVNVVKGIQGNANLESKGKQEKQQLYVSITLKDGKKLDLEAKDEAMRQRLFLGFTQLAMEKREEKRKKEADGEIENGNDDDAMALKDMQEQEDQDGEAASQRRGLMPLGESKVREPGGIEGDAASSAN